MFDGTCSFYMFHALPSWFWTGDCTEDHIFTEEELAATPVTFSTPPTPEGPARTEPKLEDAPDAARAGPKLEEPARTKPKLEDAPDAARAGPKLDELARTKIETKAEPYDIDDPGTRDFGVAPALLPKCEIAQDRHKPPLI